MPQLRLCDCRRRSVLTLSCLGLLAATTGPASFGGGSARAEPPVAASSRRHTPVVLAVRACADSVVNIQGQKTVAATSDAAGATSAARQVNGMGTGVVIDPRGYILTNFHVVDGVRQINVTLASGAGYIARIVARDRETDLAVIRIRTPQPLPVIELGTSADLMTGESVVAVGNAFGYENTVTTGVISALHRNVQVNETQKYLDLIQTDASINPGNSGGPLLNIEGKMIGVNVAVRAGAQGIGFAIPVDKALDVATRLISIERIDHNWHGMTPLAQRGAGGPVTVAKVERDSPADRGGIRAGDRLDKIGSTEIQRPIDVERALLGRRTGDRVAVEVHRDGKPVELDLVLARHGEANHRFARQLNHERLAAEKSSPFDRATWDAFGLLLRPASRSTLRQRGLPFSGGMEVVDVKQASSAAQQGVVKGDVLVYVHRWYTTSEQDVRYVLARRDSLAKVGPVRFVIVRGGQRYFGHLALNRDAAARR